MINSQAKLGFIVTKPLQLMVTLSIIQQLPIDPIKEILIVDAFSEACRISDRLSRLRLENCCVTFTQSHAEAFSYACRRKYEKLFIDSDVGFARNLTLIRIWLSSPRTEVCVYEEGIGSYRSDLYSGGKKKILEWLGCGVYFGGNWRTRKLYLFNPEECHNDIKAKKIKIDESLSALLHKRKDDFEIIFDAKELLRELSERLTAGGCNIYLSNWIVDNTLIEFLKNLGGVSILKPHPYVRNLQQSQSLKDVLLIPASVPAEMLVIAAAHTFGSVRVFHHGSSVERYVSRSNVRFILIKDKNKLDCELGSDCELEQRI